MTYAEIHKKHNLDNGRFVGGPFREMTPVSTPGLEADLQLAGIEFRKDRCDNRQHEDYGKPIVIYTITEDMLPKETA